MLLTNASLRQKDFIMDFIEVKNKLNVGFTQLGDVLGDFFDGNIENTRELDDGAMMFDYQGISCILRKVNPDAPKRCLLSLASVVDTDFCMNTIVFEEVSENETSISLSVSPPCHQFILKTGMLAGVGYAG